MKFARNKHPGIRPSSVQGEIPGQYPQSMDAG